MHQALVPALPPPDQGLVLFCASSGCLELTGCGLSSAGRRCLTGRVTFPGLGSADWVELDLDEFDIDQRANVRSHLDAAASTIGELVGDGYVIEPSNDGTAHVVVDGTRRFHAELNAAGRLVLTKIPDAEGPL